MQNNKNEFVAEVDPLLEALTQLKVSEKNKTPLIIKEVTKSSIRKQYHKSRLGVLVFVQLFTYLFSLLSILSIFIVIGSAMAVLLSHPSVELFRLRFSQGATSQQVNVIYCQLFNHIIKLRYILLGIVILITPSILTYITYFEFQPIEYVVVKSLFDHLLFINVGFEKLMSLAHVGGDLQLILQHIFFYSEIRSTSAAFNTFTILFLLIINMTNTIRRPK